MPAAPESAAPAEGDLELAADQAIEACGGDARETVKALLVANDFLERQLDKLRAKVSTGYARGRLPPARERKDEADG
ncbi:hypothetical protein [Bradyrhizobium diazoefficiens]|jgi:hypothetical protein|uniref:hypothetical protein n=1 Tax=Bradyrhizobium diazoefficiens TaxID=1355477 RepID=UPI00272C5900|nr:hypothetical protein [Bradyrhizobium diazoefficiens]WLA64930.1 hypothetical protein QNN01_43070 [Bradyrhizobium diazoefficiens]